MVCSDGPSNLMESWTWLSLALVTGSLASTGISGVECYFRPGASIQCNSSKEEGMSFSFADRACCLPCSAMPPHWLSMKMKWVCQLSMKWNFQPIRNKSSFGPWWTSTSEDSCSMPAPTNFQDLVLLWIFGCPPPLRTLDCSRLTFLGWWKTHPPLIQTEDLSRPQSVWWVCP